jgi:hypothetical protein
MEEIGGGSTDARPTQIVLIFNAGGNCIGDTALMNPSWLIGRRTTGRAGEIHYNQLMVECRMGQVEKRERRLSKCQPQTTQLWWPGGVTATDNSYHSVLRHHDGLQHRREVAINPNGEEMRQSTEDKDEGQRR